MRYPLKAQFVFSNRLVLGDFERSGLIKPSGEEEERNFSKKVALFGVPPLKV